MRLPRTVYYLVLALLVIAGAATGSAVVTTTTPPSAIYAADPRPGEVLRAQGFVPAKVSPALEDAFRVVLVELEAIAEDLRAERLADANAVQTNFSTAPEQIERSVDALESLLVLSRASDDPEMVAKAAHEQTVTTSWTAVVVAVVGATGLVLGSWITSRRPHSPPAAPAVLAEPSKPARNRGFWGKRQ